MKRIALIKYPKGPYAIFELPVRRNPNWPYFYQVWVGKKWHRLRTKELK